MDFGSLLVVIALFIFVGVYISIPLVNEDMKEITQAEKARTLLEAQRNAILKSISELDFDLDIGKIQPDRHDAERTLLLTKAEKIYQQLSGNAVSLGTSIQKDQLETQIASYRKTLSRIHNCTNCGVPIFAKDKYCGECGHRNQK